MCRMNLLSSNSHCSPRRCAPSYTHITTIMGLEAHSLHKDSPIHPSKKALLHFERRVNSTLTHQAEPPARHRPKLNYELSKHPLFQISKRSTAPNNNKTSKASFSRSFKSLSFKSSTSSQLKTLKEEDVEMTITKLEANLNVPVNATGQVNCPRLRLVSSKSRPLQNDLISGLPRNPNRAKSSRPDLDVLSHCPPGALDEIDGIEHVLAVR